jgi:hypothetical protein
MRALQEPDGTNPEKGGFDAEYQMVGVLMALRYLPVCGDHQLRERLLSMIRSAVTRELRAAPECLAQTARASDRSKDSETHTHTCGEVSARHVINRTERRYGQPGIRADRRDRIATVEQIVHGPENLPGAE